MTSPDNLLPSKAYVATTIHGLQDVDPGGSTSGNTEMWTALEGIRDALWNTLLGGFANMPQAITEAVGAIISAITGILDGGLPDLSDFFDGLGAQLSEIEASIANLEDIAAASSTTPAYVADIQDMATVPRSTLVEYWAGSHTHDVSGSTASGGASGGSHNHAAGTLGASATNPGIIVRMPRYTPDKGSGASSTVDYTPIVVDRAGVVRKMRWIVGVDNSIFGVDAYYMGLCIYNPATGNIEKVWDSGNIKDAQANTSSLQEVEIDMGIDQECSPGQILFVAHQQIAPGALQGSRSFAATRQAGVARPSSLLLDACHYTTPGRVGSIPSSVALSSLGRNNDKIPWAAISVDTSGA